MKNFIYLTLFNFKRLFKHWSSYILIALTIGTIVFGCFFSKKLNTTSTTVNIQPSSYSYLVKSMPNIKISSKKPDLTIKINKKKNDNYSIIASSSNDENELGQQICSELKNNIINLYLVKHHTSIPNITIKSTTSVKEKKSNNTLPFLLLIAYVTFVLIGVMSFVAISTEKISKMLMIISSKVSIKKIIYSKVMSILLFVFLMFACSLTTFLILNMCKIVSVSNIIHAINMSSKTIFYYAVFLILGILQTIFIYGIFAMLIKDSSELHTGMMIPTALELLAWFISFSMVNIHKNTILNWIYAMPLTNVLFNIKNVILNNNIRLIGPIFTTFILFVLFNYLIYKALKIKNETRLLKS